MLVIPLSQGLITAVSPEDAPLAEYKWTAGKRGGRWYAFRNDSERGSPIYLHHKVLPDCPPGFVRDHRNGLSLDNRRDNLRIVTHAENLRNLAGARGVRRKRGKWQAYITIPGVGQRSLGIFTDQDEAIRARLRGEVEHFGGYPAREELYRGYGIRADREGAAL